MEEHELLHLTLSIYTLGSSFSRKHLHRGGVCIFVPKDLNINKTDILPTCREKDLEICAVELETVASKLIVLRAPTGDFNHFLTKLDDTLKYLCKPKSEFLLCGDINTDYLLESNQEKIFTFLINNL